MTIRTYQKAGESIRWEKTRGVLAAVRVSEAGVAREESDTFTVKAVKTGLTTDEPEANEVAAFAKRLDFGERVEVERFTILSGHSAHRIEAGSESREWNESFARLHISLVERRHRARISLDLGGALLRDIDLDIVTRITRALENFKRSAPRVESVELVPHVAALLWSKIALARLDEGLVPLEQSTHPDFRFDGDGREIKPLKLSARIGWPNRYRPSYRSRPLALPFHVRALLVQAGHRAKHQAVGVLEPFRIRNRMLTAVLLCTAGAGESFALNISVRLEELARGKVVERHQGWFPYAAGAWGSETLLDLTN